jgi:bifunctional non-homologous end joining protein LigD
MHSTRFVALAEGPRDDRPAILPVGSRNPDTAALPEWIRLQLTQLVDHAPDGPEWLHEIKFDGYRMHARLDRGAVRLLTRTGLDWTHKYPAIAAAVASLGAEQAYRDGELCGVRPDGVTSFSMIQARYPTAATPRRWCSSCSIFCTSTAKISAHGH